ncbi:MAG: 2-oxoacid:ferredoxin oxidoreductase subunit beta [Alphaproteobacteria bacterium]|nr:2-oxoacid:ferredoxin oxidoreductase subunit beta [Alphaproteobacteria bacterium]
MNVQSPPEKLKPADYASDQEVRWCPGCGDYAIVKGVQRTMAEMQADPAKTVFISGIGCAARFPYYMATYGFHTIHGRAPAIATGVKLTNPELDVWVIGGDGDMLSIGGNHTMHVVRRNIDLQVLLFNNEIYGLTKGQASPTSKVGTRSPSTPMGSVDAPVSACNFVLGCNGRFVARVVDTDQKLMPDVLIRAKAHKGTSFVEILQNCIVYNDGVYSGFTEKNNSADGQVKCEHGKPLIFGKDGNKGLRMKPGKMEIEVVTIGEDGVTEGDILVHDETNRPLAQLLSAMQPPHFPVAMGVIFCDPAATSYEEAVYEQIAKAAEASPPGELNALLRRGRTWTVDA